MKVQGQGSWMQEKGRKALASNQSTCGRGSETLDLVLQNSRSSRTTVPRSSKSDASVTSDHVVVCE